RLTTRRPYSSCPSPRQRGHELVHVPGEHVERHIAAEHDGIVECLEVETRAERRRRPFALTIDLAVPHLLAARLPGPRAIAVDLARDFQRVRSVDVDEELDRLLAR